jgi:uncharacterized protein YceH (UPF0502 family)
MIPRLDSIEVRVLGCLLEKEKTTPEYYPLTPNALTNACNQKSSRDPVMEVTQSLVIRAIFSLKDQGFIVEKNEEGGRVAKYGHNFSKVMTASEPERAVLCLLMLRGPQTAGEIRNRADRLAEFKSPAEVETILQGLATRADGPFTILLPRQPGQKERRYAHLFSGEPTVTAASSPAPKSVETAVSPLEDRLANLEKRVQALEELIKKNP